MTPPTRPDQTAVTAPARLVRLNAAGTGIAAIGGLEEACRSAERFGALIDAGHVEGHGRGEGRKEIARRLRTLRAEMGRCLALAFVVTTDDLARQRRRVRAARLMFGCPVEAFDSIEDAVSWLADHGATASGEAGA